MITPRHVLITCDMCGLTYSVLGPACESWPDFKKTMEGMGWSIGRNHEYCPVCRNLKRFGAEVLAVPTFATAPVTTPAAPKMPCEYNSHDFLSAWTDILVRIRNLMAATQEGPQKSASMAEAMAADPELAAAVSKMDQVLSNEFSQAFAGLFQSKGESQ